MDSINYSERNKKKKNIILNINQNLTRNNFHRNTELYYFPSSSSPNIIESEKEKKNIRKKLFLESFSAGEKIFFLGGNFSNKIKQEINKNKNICNINIISNASSYFKK